MSERPMQTNDVRALSVGAEATIREAAECINRNRHGIALVLDDAGRLLDTVTDGDLRRAVLDSVPLTAPVSVLKARKGEAYREPTVARFGTDRGELLRLLHERSVRQLPLVDEAGRVVEVATADDLLPDEVIPLEAVVMAGGFGTRLHPLTSDTPKPMLPVGDRPLLEHIIGRLRDTGIRRVNVTTHFHPEKIRDHFGDGQAFGVDITYVNEDRPLGTAGALGLLAPPTERMLVVNGDVLTDVDYRKMLRFHLECEADLTVGVRQYDLQVPYGVMECDGPNVRQIREKPVYTFFVSAGIYLLEPSAHRYVPAGERLDMPDLIRRLVDAGRTVVSFPIMEYWLDIGQHVDYARAQDDAQNGRVAG